MMQLIGAASFQRFQQEPAAIQHQPFLCPVLWNRLLVPLEVPAHLPMFPPLFVVCINQAAQYGPINSRNGFSGATCRAGRVICSCFGFRRFAGRLRRFSSAWLIPPRRWRFRLRQGRRPHRSPVHRHAPSMRGRPCATGQALPPGSRRSRAGTTTAGRS